MANENSSADVVLTSTLDITGVQQGYQQLIQQAKELKSKILVLDRDIYEAKKKLSNTQDDTARASLKTTIKLLTEEKDHYKLVIKEKQKITEQFHQRLIDLSTSATRAEKSSQETSIKQRGAASKAKLSILEKELRDEKLAGEARVKAEAAVQKELQRIDRISARSKAVADKANATPGFSMGSQMQSPLSRGLVSFGFGMMGAGIPGTSAISSASIGYGFGGGAGLVGAGAAAGVIAAISAGRKLIDIYSDLSKKAYDLSTSQGFLDRTMQQSSQTWDLAFTPAITEVARIQEELATWASKNQDTISDLADTMGRLAVNTAKWVESLFLFMTGSGNIEQAMSRVSGWAESSMKTVGEVAHGIGIMLNPDKAASLFIRAAQRAYLDSGMALQANGKPFPSMSSTGTGASSTSPRISASENTYQAIMSRWSSANEQGNLRSNTAQDMFNVNNASSQKNLEDRRAANRIKEEEINLLRKQSEIELSIVEIQNKRKENIITELEAEDSILKLKIQLGELEVESLKKSKEIAEKTKGSTPADILEADAKILDITKNIVEAEYKLEQIRLEGYATLVRIAAIQAQSGNKDLRRTPDELMSVPMPPVPDPELGPAAAARYFDENSSYFERQMMPPVRPMTTGQALERTLSTTIQRFSAFNSILGRTTGTVAIAGRAFMDLSKISINGSEAGSMMGGLKGAFSKDPVSGKFSAANMLQGVGAVAGIVSSVIGVIGSIREMFTAAAKKVAESIGKEVDNIMEATNNSGRIGKGIAELKVQRDKALTDLGGKKGGQKQLDELLPSINKNIEELSTRQKEIFDSFETSLNRLRLGDRFQDIFNDISTAENQIKDFLASLDDPTTGIPMVEEMMSLTVDKITKNWHERWDDEWDSWVKGAEDAAGNLISIDEDANQRISDENTDYQKAQIRRTKELADLKKNFSKQEEQDIKRISELKEALIKLDIDEAKGILDIQNEGIAERQITTGEDKRQRIADLQDESSKERTNIHEQISDLEELRSERFDAFQENLTQMAEAESQAWINHDNTVQRIVNQTQRRRDQHLENMRNLQEENAFIQTMIEHQNDFTGTWLEAFRGGGNHGLVIGQIYIEAPRGGDWGPDEVADAVQNTLNSYASGMSTGNS